MGKWDGRPSGGGRVLQTQMVVAALMGVRLVALRDRRRGLPRVCFARQVAMYLCHLAFGMSFAAVARAFRREPSAVWHAVRRIREARADPELDRTLTWLEASLKEAAHA